MLKFFLYIKMLRDFWNIHFFQAPTFPYFHQNLSIKKKREKKKEKAHLQECYLAQ